MDGDANLAPDRSAQGNDRLDLPGASDRTIIVGQNGSGKTWFGVWLLSHQDYDRRPWIIVDYKREELFTQLGKNSYRSILDPDSAPPKKPGLHLLQPFEADDEAVNDFFWRVWQRRGIGIYIDEATMVPAGKGSALRAILTQGRSMKIPVIALSQRPVDIDRFFFSEAKFFAEFFLMDRDDRVTLKRYTPFQPDDVPEAFHCYWYDAARRLTKYLAPVPDATTILDRIRSRAPRRLFFG